MGKSGDGQPLQVVREEDARKCWKAKGVNESSCQCHHRDCMIWGPELLESRTARESGAHVGTDVVGRRSCSGSARVVLASDSRTVSRTSHAFPVEFLSNLDRTRRVES